MNTSPLIAAGVSLCLLAASAAPRGDYDARIRVLGAVIDGLDALPERARAQLHEGLKLYADARERLLKDLVAVVDSKRPDPARWRSLVAKGKDLPEKIFERLDSAVRREGFAQVDRLHALVQQEIAFFELIAKTDLGLEHEIILKNAQGLREMIKNLDKKWGRIVDLDDKVDDQWEDYWEEIFDVYGEFDREMQAAVDDYIATLKRGPAGVGGKAAQWLDTLAGRLKTVTAILATAKKSLESTHAKAMRKIAPRELDVVQLFLNNRKKAKQFVDDHGLHHAEKALERADKKAERAAGAMPGDGQRADADKFFAAVLAKLGKHLEAAEAENKRFLSENQGRFLGKVSTSTRGALLEEDEWDRQGGRVPAQDVVALVRRMDTEYFRDPPWRGGGLSETLREQIKEHLDAVWLEVAKQDTVFLKTLQENDFKKVVAHRKKLATRLERDS